MPKPFKLIKNLSHPSPRSSSRAYTSPVYHLVFYKWQQEKENNTLSLLQMWADIGSDLVHGHYFTNGNKRTALLAMMTFIRACGFSLKSDKNNEIFLTKWEKLLIDVATAKSEKLAMELIKKKINQAKSISELPWKEAAQEVYQDQAIIALVNRLAKY